MLPRDIMTHDHGQDEQVNAGDKGFVPDMSLKIETQEDLLALKYADSITIDPHKAGYIHYPAGSLVYRDERMRYLVAWSCPYIGRGSVTNIGNYGVEGSKPGAAAVSIWLANNCIGLDQNGYGALLSEATFTCTRLAAHWAAMTTSADSFICVALNRLPSEINGGDIEAEKQFIRDEILLKTNKEIQEADATKHTMTLLRALGSDLNINAFALNWRYEDGRLNDDIEEANYLMLRVVKELSINSPNENPLEKDFYLTSTEFEHEEYGSCVEGFMDRLGIARSRLNLMVLRNVVMSPFSSEHGLIQDLVKRFRQVVEDAVEICRNRNAIKPDIHRFYIQGTRDIFLVYRPRFQEARFRRQLILKARFDKPGMDAYTRARTKTGDGVIYFHTAKETSLEGLLNRVKNHGEAHFGGVLFDSNGTVLSNIHTTVYRIIKNRSLTSRNREDEYPSTYMPFYLYGSPNRYHISHILLKAPNIELGAANIKLDLDPNTTLATEELSGGAILCMTSISEAPMQPFPASTSNDFFFRPGQQSTVKIWRDLKRAEESGPNLLPASIEDFGPEICSGTITLGSDVLVDAKYINRDPFGKAGEDEDDHEQWRELFRGLEQISVE